MRRRYRNWQNAPGDFYVEDGCCTMCGVWEAEAPGLMSWGKHQCYVARQAASPAEVASMIEAIAVADMDCIRYSGRDTSIRQRIAEIGCEMVLDPPGESLPEAPANHLSVRANPGIGPDDLFDLLVRTFVEAAMWPYKKPPSRWRSILSGVWSLRASGDGSHVLDVGEDPVEPGRLLVHLLPPSLICYEGQLVHQRLMQDGRFEDFRWWTEREWQAKGPWRSDPRVDV